MATQNPRDSGQPDDQSSGDSPDLAAAADGIGDEQASGAVARAAGTARATAGQAWHKTGELTGQARQAVTAHPAPSAVRYLAAAAAGGAAVAVAVWVVQRRRARRATAWQQATRTAQQTAAHLRGAAAQLLDEAGELANAVKDSELTASAADRARHIAANPATTMRVQGVAATTAALAAARWLRHRAQRATPRR